ncbi:hypothetical protein CO115_01755 [Candidatus Falkowbacteria bacterium CG_4_9_14_3_um_filter_36_9]|uniref:DNA polymerase III subunit delta n=2 Tax=Candidatus Falkowiibacteriota TaxID=1752728 RepID=A0A1J4T6E7_9BACT|nr:MAG: hypothetical protein AUJ27_04080 [Candidatus Falkowbacteria bacterium CG1_02_37_44]PIV50778.1 MAG: hypothetical protein COS18_04055 [Candidatus Falkowbacteria bacterium CG02_land_8_20_14_3_00_36_14]PIX12162.1 MAG: hypothetical protein COZ73_00810 [Candidatus Falkowbacteria bacterium CG_4_8_14_3_um_filter_36_11]PJA10982.1 MAG: hypothetical protein COX67_02170 [Candidatus Falkowbacteria bacterium CG_4_10_14_0_2_um_filter_36_22]PJB20173.1 MAG: hypothetical protein CO115_01755 [Candidatus F
MNKRVFNWPLVGNRQITEFLSRSINNNKLAGTYIFAGPDNLGKTTTASYFSQILLCQAREKNIKNIPCNECSSCKIFLADSLKEDAEESGSIHSDYCILKKKPEEKNISIDDARDFIHRLNLSSFLNSYKIGVIKRAHQLSLEAANALLKTLEEPKKNVIIILITSEIDAIPATLVSRSQILKFKPVPADVIYDYLINIHKAPRSAAKNFSRSAMGRPALAVKLLEDKEFYNNYYDRAISFFKILPADINARFHIAGDLIGRDNKGQVAAAAAGRIIEIWSGLVRDLLLLKYNHKDIIQHQFLDKELEQSANILAVGELLSFNSVLEESKKYLDANVPPKLVLENIVIKI